MALEGTVDPTIDPSVSAVEPPAAPVAGTPHPDKLKWDTERSGFIRDLQKERQRGQTFEQQLATAKAEVESERRRVQALAGVATKSQDETDIDEVKKRFGTLFPHLAELTAEDVRALRETQSQVTRLRDSEQRMWQDKAVQMVEMVEAAIVKDIGGDLSQRQKDAIRAGYVQAANDPDFLERHTRGDKKLPEEFAKQWIEDWFEPARRKITQQQLSQQRRVPGARDRSVPGSTTPKIDVKDDNAVADLLAQGYRERNGGFGRK